MSYRFKTTQEAEDYFWANIADHNEDEAGLSSFLEDMGADKIEEVDLENRDIMNQNR